MSGPSTSVAANATPVWESAPPGSVPFVGRQLTTTGGVALAAHACARVTIKALSTNVAPVALGFAAGVTTTTGFVMSAGDSLTLFVSNTNLLFVVGANTTDVITYIGA